MTTKPIVTIETTGPTLLGAKIIGPNGGQIDCSRLTFHGDVHKPNHVTIEIPLVSLRTQAEADFIVTHIDGKRYRLSRTNRNGRRGRPWRKRRRDFDRTCHKTKASIDQTIQQATDPAAGQPTDSRAQQEGQCGAALLALRFLFAPACF